MGNIVPRAGIEHTSLAFRAITPCRLPDITTMPTLNCLCSSLPHNSVQTTTWCVYIYIYIYHLSKIISGRVPTL